MSAEYLVVGEFTHIESTKSAIGQLRSRGYERLELYSPFPCHELDEEMYRGKKRSPVRRFALAGGLTGCLGAFLMTSWMSLDWPLQTSAKPILSYPAFVVIGFECTILIGAIFTLVGMLANSGIPLLHVPAGYRPKFSEGTFGLSIRVPKEQVDTAKSELLSCGAKELEVKYVR